MNVLFLTHRLPFAPNRGDRIRAYYLLREMSRFAEVSLFSLVHDDEEAAEAGHVPFARETVTVRVPRLVNYARGLARLPSRRPLTHSLLDAPGAVDAIARLAGQRPPDVVVAFCSGMARLAMAPPLASRPFVLDMVDVDSVKWREMAARSKSPLRVIYAREARTLGAFEIEAARRAVTTLVVNEREREALVRAAPDADVAVVENGVEFDAFAPPGPPAADPVVVFCGVMNYAPNDEGARWFVTEIWPLVKARRPDARLDIVGMGPSSALRTLTSRDPSIAIAGRVPAVQPHLWRAALAIAPLRLARGVQNKVLEALAAGLPVVVTPAVMGGLPAEVAPGCLVGADARTFADHVVTLLGSTAGERRARAAQANLAELGWAVRLRSLQPILERARERPVA